MYVLTALGHRLLLNGTDLQLPYPDSRLPLFSYNSSQLTDDTGCITYTDFRWREGPSGPLVMIWVSDDAVSSGFTYLVNPDEPIYSQMSFILGHGQFQVVWYVSVIVFAVVLKLDRR